MLLKKGKKLRFLIYTLLIIVLSSINNYDFNIGNIFNINHVNVDGFSKKKNMEIRNEIKDVLGKNIFITKKNDFIKLTERNDTKYLIIKKIYPNKLLINIFPAKPICIILTENEKIILGDNGKKLKDKIEANNLPTVLGSKNIEDIFILIKLLKLSKLNYALVKNITFFKSGRFDIKLKSGMIIKFPIKYDIEIINYGNNLLNQKKFINSKIIDLRIKNRIIKYE